MKAEIKVHLDKTIDRSYRIVIRKGVLNDLSTFVLRRWEGKHVFIITDTNVGPLWGQHVQRRLFEVGINALLLSFPAGEASKNFKTVHAVQTQLLENGVRRDSVIIALGGGVVGDVAGYVAATILRGIAFIQIPTTVLAQVDSSVGGKVGIDHPLGKNLIGAFHQPAAVFIDPNVLATLSSSEFRNGLAEVVKIAAALDKNFFTFLERHAGSLRKTNHGLLSQIIYRSVALKAGVVEKDEFESGIRKALNLGHTIGHAIEAASNFSIKHGEAVAIGVVAEARIAVRLGLLTLRDLERVARLLRALKLPTTISTIKNRARFFAALSADKKSEGNTTKFVLLNGIGTSVIGIHGAEDILETMLTKQK